VIRCLQEEGVEHVFGYPGGAVLFIYDAIFKQKAVKHVLVRHEQGALHAADGYARATGKCGVALVTSGPGVTNAVTGICTAYMDSIPMVVLTGQVSTRAIGEDAVPGVRHRRHHAPDGQAQLPVKDVNELATTIKKAFHIATTGRPGPVVVDIPKDVSMHTARFHYPEKVSLRSYAPVTRGHGGQIKKALNLLLEAKRPMIYVGGGAILGEASAEVTELVRLLGYPVTNTLMGLGSYPANDKQFLGMLGMHGTWEANHAMQNCDVLLAVGARFDDRVIGDPKHFAAGNPTRKIVHIDVDPSSISKRVRVDVPIVGGVKEVLHGLIAQLKAAPQRPDPRGARRMVGADRRVARQGLPQVQPQVRAHQAAIRDREALRGHQGRRVHHERRGPAPDVGRAVLPLRQAAALDQLRRPRDDGRGPALRDGREDGVPGRRGRLRDRRGLDPDVHPGALDLQAVPPAGEDREPEQPLHGHGPPVAGVLPRQPLRRVVHGRAARLREARRGLRPRRHEDREAGDVEGALREAFAMKDRLVFLDFITDQTENVFRWCPAARASRK
jgi:acetolactate synthase-1/2/3 large subunit